MATIAADAGLPPVSRIEEAGLAAWPAHEEVRGRAWVRRASRGFSKRANSLLSLDPDDDEDVAERLAEAGAWFAARGLPTTVRVTPLTGARLGAAVSGWHEFEATQVMVAGLSGRHPVHDAAIAVSAPRAAEWLAAQQALHGHDSGQLAALRGIVERMGGPAFGLVLRGPRGAPLASCYMSCAAGLAFLGAVVTAPAERRKGHARRVVEAGMGLAAAAGATMSVLQVLGANTGAQALYAGLGYRPHYTYTHRRQVAA